MSLFIVHTYFIDALKISYKPLIRTSFFFQVDKKNRLMVLNLVIMQLQMLVFTDKYLQVSQTISLQLHINKLLINGIHQEELPHELKG